MRNHKKNFDGFTPTPTLALFRFWKTYFLSINMFFERCFLVKYHGETKKQRQSWCRGFTVIEMIVSIGLFTIVLFISSSAFLVVLNADRKSRVTRIATDNLSLSLEDMSRRIKTGTTYNCGGGITGVANCVLPGQNSIAFTEQDGVTRTTYRYVSAGKFIERVRGLSVLRVTAPEIEINNLRFVVGGTAVGPSLGGTDVAQPYVIILIDGETKIGAITSSFKIQAMVTQRAYDI